MASPLCFQADNDLNFAIVKGVRHHEPAIDIKSAFEAGLHGLDDPEILELAASAGRILISHDQGTMLMHFRDRLAEGKSSPGILIAAQAQQIGSVIESIILLWSSLNVDDTRDQAIHIPSLLRHSFTR